MTIKDDVKKSNIQYMAGEIEHVIKTFGDRDPGSEGELKTLDYMANDLKNYADTVVQESFSVHPESFYGWMPITATFLIIATVLNFFFPIAALICVVLSVVPMLSQFIFYTPLLDKLYKKRTSGNILASKKPSGEIKRRIVLNGHSDAAYEWHWHYVGGFKLMLIVIFLPLLGLFLMLGLSIANIAMYGIGAPVGVSKILSFVSLAFIPFYSLLFFFSNCKKVVPGANDNLSACYMAIGAMKTLQDANINLENTELCCLITGSEEAGLRGAKAWAKRHQDFGQDVETIFITFETLRELEHLHVYTKDMNGMVPNDKEVSSMLREMGKKNGLNMKYGSVFLGSTDSAAFSAAGFRSTAIAGMAPNIKNYYHTRRDNYDNLNQECLSKVLDITLDTLSEYDTNGLAIAKAK